MRIATGSLLSVLLFSASSHAATVFVPVINASARPIPSQMFPFQPSAWVSTLTVSNPGETPLTYRFTAIFGGLYAQIPSYCAGSFTVQPNTSTLSYPYLTECALPGVGGLAFVQMDLDPGLVLTGEIRLGVSRNCCQELNSFFVPLASAPLPVYGSLFPASSVVTSTEIVDPAGLALPSGSRDVNDPLTRRVNLTIFNAGKEAATATITVVGSAAPPIVVALQSEEVGQVNDVFPEGGRVLVVTASQPFLCYASSVITYSDPTRASAIAVYSFQQVQ
jgi:hypothetical protein